MNRNLWLTALCLLFALPFRAGAGPSILIVGTSHFGRMDDRPTEAEVERVNDALAAYEPDMVAVEYLPADWPAGRGRDYRPDPDLAALADSWRIPMDEVGARLEAARAESRAGGNGARCRLGTLHFLSRDFTNAVYYFQTADCDVESYPEVGNLVANLRAHEMSRIGFEQARRRDLPGVVSFDYQGEDADWFIFDAMAEAQDAGGRAREQVTELKSAVQSFRAKNDEHETGSLIERLRYQNSRAFMDRQQRFYEEVMPRFRFRDAGERQLDNYWLRNERMFDNIERAAEARDAKRVLVVVGKGHKYFLDELARRRGFEWVDPLQYLGD